MRPRLTTAQRRALAAAAADPEGLVSPWHSYHYFRTSGHSGRHYARVTINSLAKYGYLRTFTAGGEVARITGAGHAALAAAMQAGR